MFAAGESLNHTVQVSASTPQTAGVQLTVSAAQGGLFSGSQQRVNSGLRAELGPLSMNANYTFLRLRGPPDPLDLNGDGQLGEGSSKTHLLGFGLTILPNERFTVTSQVQANNTFLAGQLIVSWEFRRFDFLQFVYSEDGALENAFTADVANRAALVKLSWHLGL